MATGDNPIVPLFPGDEPLTFAASAAIAGGKFVKPSGTFLGGPLLDLSTPTGPMVSGNLPQVATCGAGQKGIGVSRCDAAAAPDPIPVFVSGAVVPMVAGTGGVTVGQQVESDASGNPITWGGTIATQPLGIAISTATATNIVWIKLY